MSRAGNSSSLPAQAVQVVSSTWARDSHDLFDFEAHQLHKHNFSLQKSAKCVRSGTDIQMLGDTAEPAAGTDPLLRVVERSGSFWVDRMSPSSSSRKLWLVVRDVAAAGYRLAEGDVIKLGRFKFRVRQLATPASGDVEPELRLDDNGNACPADCTGNSTAMCRICLLEGPGDDDPLIAPCKCKGSIEYVHLRCLRYWIRGRLNISDNPNGSYFYQPLACELCKAVYPTHVQQEEKKSPLVEVPRTQPPFVVLESMVRDSQQHSRGLHVISLAEKALKLGRGHESDVRISDVSISRHHATIRFHEGQFLLQDQESKFGTLVAMKKPRQLESGRPLSIQVGRTVLALSLQAQSELAIPSPLQNLPSSAAEDERALRLSLLTRGSRALASLYGGAATAGETSTLTPRAAQML